MSYERDINITVKDLKDILKDLPDDMYVIVTSTPDDDPNYLYGFRHLRTAGILINEYEDEPALCLAPSRDGYDMSSLIKQLNGDTICDKVLF